MTTSSRTPEGMPSECPQCGAETKVDISDPAGDARCPNCAHLVGASVQVPLVQSKVQPPGNSLRTHIPHPNKAKECPLCQASIPAPPKHPLDVCDCSECSVDIWFSLDRRVNAIAADVKRRVHVGTGMPLSFFEPEISLQPDSTEHFPYEVANDNQVFPLSNTPRHLVLAVPDALYVELPEKISFIFDTHCRSGIRDRGFYVVCVAPDWIEQRINAAYNA